MGLEQVELVMEVEDELGISIDADADYGQSANTVGAFYDLVLRIVLANPHSELAQLADLDQYLWNCIAKLSAQHSYNMKPNQITRETRFIEDLGYG